MAVQYGLKYNKSQDLLKMYEHFMIFWDSFMFFMTPESLKTKIANVLDN